MTHDHLPESDRRPIIICAYVSDTDLETVRKAFGFGQARGAHLPFFAWKDEALIGPERAFQHCWSQCPDRDVIIIHPDMAPLPGDEANRWYDDLCAYAAKLPDAGAIACDLLYDVKSPRGNYYVQCAGGVLENGQIRHVGGHVDRVTGRAGPQAVEYDRRFQTIRQADWVTFGGVYLRRQMLDQVGKIDERYKWAYVIDVDYCLEARLRGFNHYQVPVNLLHQENGSTRTFLQQKAYQDKVDLNIQEFSRKWAGFLSSYRSVTYDPRDRPVSARSRSFAQRLFRIFGRLTSG